MSILKLQAPVKDNLWGGRRLIDEYNKKTSGDIAAESWELSCYPQSESVIENGEFAGKPLTEYIWTKGKKILGKNCEKFEDFPILIKFIDARKDLSLQVHPSDEYALKNENQYGKTEMWYIIDAEEGSFLYYGFNREITKEEFARRIEDETLTEVLNAYPVQKGDVVFIEAGTLHAIGAGILLAEIQQNSNVTYRVYDYGRRDKDGNLRELHVDKALEVTNLYPVKKVKKPEPHIGTCKYFTVDKVNLTGDKTNKVSGIVSDDSFLHILILEGEGTITVGDEKMDYKKGDSYFIPAESGEYELAGKCEAIFTYVL
ncbi:type I phosphomannose isomerase catalytic subunit [Butyrivibrio sp. NC2002]|uniref:type I phosphomannose isomerase catalytic subunit n=1 Tax=Butyrivibrio sp. NC2002 TaxID=1410610 RepID=UPI000559D0F5|nr:type I phosphomannose isomerase catalytic subunit [Butyrivibrio sp. NC2002]